MNDIPRFGRPTNEKEFDYARSPGGRSELDACLANREVFEIPAVIGGRRIYSDDIEEVRAPHEHQRLLARVYKPDAAQVQRAIVNSLSVAADWAALPFASRATVFLRAAEIIAGRARQEITAMTMLGQSKVVDQAEPDAACELIDFLRFNVYNAQHVYADQPPSTASAMNRTDWRALEGFVYAVSPFNFTAIGANLSCAPALMGNVCVWKPSFKSALANYRFFQALEEAGLPPGVINFVPADPVMATSVVMDSHAFAGLHFTGSSQVFRNLWRKAGERVDHYRTLPRLVGETGGKDFVIVHPSADVDAAVVGLVRAAFEYQGQKCSAASRLYVPRSLWPRVRAAMQDIMAGLKVGDVADASTFMGAVIDKAAHARISARISALDQDSQASVVQGGRCWSNPGYFVEPTLVEVLDPRHALMQDELFGPVLAAFVYEDGHWDQTLHLVDQTSVYALTGSIYCLDRGALARAQKLLCHAAGNLYVNDKPTGAVVGEQPFGGSRASGSNDKAGSWMNLMRWTSPRVIKESYAAPRNWEFDWSRR
jgi:1-pyrroline-5-carboxylate dehydrogenase